MNRARVTSAARHREMKIHAAVNTAVMELPDGTPTGDLLDAVAIQLLTPMSEAEAAQAEAMIGRMT